MKLRKNSCNRVTARLRSNSRIRATRLHPIFVQPDFRLRSVHSCIYVYLLCSNGIPHLLSVSPNTHPLLLHPDKNGEQEMAPSVPRTRAAAALRMKQIALDNQDCTIRRLRAQLATERRRLAATKKELEETQVALEASHKVIVGLTEIGLSMSKKTEKMKVKKQQVRANHVECHQKFQARIHEAEDSMQAQHLLIEALVDEKDSLLQTIHGLQEANNAHAPFDGEWEEELEEEPEEEEIEDAPLGEGEIDDE
ncbi:receptor-like protein kinase [Dorcoceras hygrometricum]|uniref:Receptor-like protein kinase n=1 Tax=Dorcoceras hygrometricum TaxID=472368 RepID=A0A2Z7CEK6_9LAMI|nr:receptor-like protein kinase [Dorcoceras hygrometricum]